MARGKYAKKAEGRREEAEVTATIADYQHKVARLTTENRELRERLETTERNARTVERRLRTERDEGVAPQVVALSDALRNAVAERDRALSKEKRTLNTWSRGLTRLKEHFEKEHSVPSFEAFEIACQVLGIMDEEKVLIEGGRVSDKFAERADNERIHALQRQKGLRR